MKHLISGSLVIIHSLSLSHSISFPASWLEEAKAGPLFLGSFSVIPGSRADRRLTDDVIASKLNISCLKPTKRLQLPWFTCVTRNTPLTWAS